MSSEVILSLVIAGVGFLVNLGVFLLARKDSAKSNLSETIHYVVVVEVGKAVLPLDKDLDLAKHRLAALEAVLEEKKMHVVALEKLIYRLNGDVVELQSFFHHKNKTRK